MAEVCWIEDSDAKSIRMKKEDELWDEFSRTGKLPPVPSLEEFGGVVAIHDLLRSEYDSLQRVLCGEALAQKGGLSTDEEECQVGAARWVLRRICSSKRKYDNKEVMRDDLLGFMKKSKNRRLVLASGLIKGDDELRGITEERERLSRASKFAKRLGELVSEDSSIKEMDEFVRLAISVGWIFRKAEKSDELAGVLQLLPRYVADDRLVTNIGKLKDGMQFLAEKPLREWFGRAKEESKLEALGQNAICIFEQLFPLVGVGGWYDGPKIMKEGGEFESRRVALWYVCRFLEKYKNNGIPSSCAEIALRIFQKDGLRNLSLPFFERNRKERPSGVELQPHDRCYYPSLVEKIAKQIYRCCKSLYGKQKGEDGALMPDLKWAIDLLDGVYTKYTDDEWGDFRIGKLLVWSGDSVQAKARLLPVIRRKQAEFWAWDLLGDLFYSKREACVARALLCAAKEEYIKNLKQEAKQLAMPVDDKVAMSRVAEPALDLLLFGITPKKGILLESFRTKDGKTRLVFSDGSGINIRPTSPEIVVGANGLTEGGPVFLFYTQEEDGCGLFAVKPRPTGQLWDALPIRNAVYLESFKDKNGKRISAFASNGTRFCYFDSIDGCEPGDPLAVRFSDRHREDRSPECVWITKDLSRMRKPWDESKSDVVVYYGKSRTGASYLLSSGTCKYNVPKGKFDGLTDATLGDAFRIHYVVRVKKDKERVLDVVDCQKSDERNASLVVPFVGAVEIKASQAAGATNSGLSVGYVDVFDGSSGYGHAYNLNAERRLRPSGSVFIPPELIDVHGIRNGFMVSGMAVRLPPKMHESASGRYYENKCYQAIEVRVENGDVEKGNRIEAEVRC